MGMDTNSAVPRYTLREKLGPGSELNSFLCLMCQRPLVEPRQCDCGDRICSVCYNSLLARSTRKFQCQHCDSELTTDECFRDKAVDSDLQRAVFPCFRPNCPWTGSALNYRDHIDHCKYTPVNCPNAGCGFQGLESDLAHHLATCPAHPVKCRWCEEAIPRNTLTDHISMACSGAVVKCAAGCGEQLLRREMSNHLQKDCSKQMRLCKYRQFGCPFVGNFDELNVHEKQSTVQHLVLVSDVVHDKRDQENSERVPAITASDMQRQKEATDRELTTIHGELLRLAEETGLQIAPLREGIMKLESSLAELQDGFSELALMVARMTGYTV